MIKLKETHSLEQAQHTPTKHHTTNTHPLQSILPNHWATPLISQLPHISRQCSTICNTEQRSETIALTTLQSINRFCTIHQPAGSATYQLQEFPFNSYHPMNQTIQPPAISPTQNIYRYKYKTYKHIAKGISQ